MPSIPATQGDGLNANIAVLDADDPKVHLNVSFDMRVGKQAKKVLNRLELKNAGAFKNTKSVSP